MNPTSKLIFIANKRKFNVLNVWKPLNKTEHLESLAYLRCCTLLAFTFLANVGSKIVTISDIVPILNSHLRCQSSFSLVANIDTRLVLQVDSCNIIHLSVKVRSLQISLGALVA